MRWLKGSAAYLPKRLKLNSQVHWKDGKFSFRSNVKFLLREWTHLKMQNGSHWHCATYFRILQLARNVLELAIPDMDGYQTNSFLEMKVEQLVWVTSHMFWCICHPLKRCEHQCIASTFRVQKFTRETWDDIIGRNTLLFSYQVTQFLVGAFKSGKSHSTKRKLCKSFPSLGLNESSIHKFSFSEKHIFKYF